VNQAGYIESLQKYKAGLSNGDLPDLAQFEETSVQTLLDSQSTVTLQDCADADHYDMSDYIPRTISYYTVNQKLRALPWPVSNPILLYDKSKFRAAGLDPDKPPETLDDLRAMSRQIVASGATKYGIALRTQDYFNEFFYAKAGQQYVNHGPEGRATGAARPPTGGDLDVVGGHGVLGRAEHGFRRGQHRSPARDQHGCRHDIDRLPGRAGSILKFCRAASSRASIPPRPHCRA
jgi:sn-glycerol 3-phosphate transport system substrate-binding protein